MNGERFKVKPRTMRKDKRPEGPRLEVHFLRFGMKYSVAISRDWQLKSEAEDTALAKVALHPDSSVHQFDEV